MAVTQTRGARRRLVQSRGFTLVEAIVALALTAAVVPAVIGAVAATTRLTDNASDRSVLFELGQSQMEEVQRQPFQNSTADAYSLISTPPGYTISVSADDVQEYEYPDPKGEPTQETLQEVIVTVTGDRGNLTLRAYKVRR